MSLVRALLFPFLLPAALAAVARVEERTTCADVHVFMARGNGEAYPGRVGAIADTVCNGLPSCDAENIQFDSTIGYCDQASEGISSGLSQIASYASACPTSHIVLAGYSLGAQIVGDILGGGGGSFYGCTEATSAPLNLVAGSHVGAVLLFGDVLHVANEPYNVGTGSGANGQYPRSGASLAALDVYSSRMQNYCLSTDPICALGNDGLSHTTYMTVYADQAGAWVQAKLGYESSGSSSSSSAAASSTTSGSASTITSTASGTASSTVITSSSVVTSSGSTSTVATTFTSSFSASSSVVTITTSSSSSSAAIGVATNSASVNTATFTPFSFSNTATASTTSTYMASVPTSALSLTTTVAFAPTSFPATTTASSVAASTSTTASDSSTATATPMVITNAAYSNSAKLGLNLITLLVIKVLAF